MSDCGCSRNKLNDYQCRVTRLEKLTERIFWLTVKCPDLAESVRPGNAIMVYPSAGLEPLLGRPFGVADADAVSGEISVCFMTLGRGTKLISELRAGDMVRIRGVFGVPFKENGAKLYLAGGGAGAALFFYMRKLYPERTAGLYLGIPGRGCEKYAELVRSLIPDAHIFTDDGSFGEGNSMFSALPKDLGADEEIWACGPSGFLRALKSHCAAQPDKLFFALDRHMACGYGGCMGCTVETVNGLKRICVDQSLFRSDEMMEDEY